MENHDSFTETSTQSWGSRITGSFKAVLFGPILFFAALAVLWSNEGRSIKTAKGLKEGASQIVTIDAGTLTESNAGKLVHLTGNVSTNEVLSDEAFGIEVNALKLKRKVKMYQWKEEEKQQKKKNIGGSETTTTTYNYEKEWSDDLIKSNHFKKPEGHLNPSSFPYTSYTRQTKTATVGSYSLNSSLISKINNFASHPINESNIASVNNASLMHEANGQQIYIGEGTNANPQIGDVKIAFEVVHNNTPYSVIGKQVNNTFEKFYTSTGTSIEMIKPGTLSADNMFEAAQKSNKTKTWAFRGLGFFLMFFGLSMFFKPLVVLADVLPFLGNLFNMGTSLLAGLIAFVVSLTTIAIAWLAYRPIVGIALIALAMGLIVFVSLKRPTKKSVVVERNR